MKQWHAFLLLLLVFPALRGDSAVVLFGRTQEAIDTPFEAGRNPGFGGLPQLFTSTDVQNAIEESLARAVSNDRYPIQADWGGNANPGRYLEIFPGINSLEAPLVIPENSIYVAVSLGSVNDAGDFTLGFFNPPNAATPFRSVTMLDGVNRTLVTGLSDPLLAADEIGVKVVSGNRNKPFVRFWIQTNL